MAIQATMQGFNYEINDVTKKYVQKKLNNLARYVPRHARASLGAAVKLKQINQSHGNKYEVEITLRVPDKVLTAKDSTLNILAAVDIVEAKLAGQLRRYKTEVLAHIGRRDVLHHFKRSYEREQQ